MAPRKRGGGGRGGLSFIFCCFNSSDHPEITYRLREDFALQSMEPALPMPGYDELDGMFSELVVRHCSVHGLFLIKGESKQGSHGHEKPGKVIGLCNAVSRPILITFGKVMKIEL